MSSNTNNKDNNTNLTEEEKYIYFELPYIGPIGENLVKQLKKKMKHFLNPSKKVNINTLQNNSLTRLHFNERQSATIEQISRCV